MRIAQNLLSGATMGTSFEVQTFSSIAPVVFNRHDGLQTDQILQKSNLTEIGDHLGTAPKFFCGTPGGPDDKMLKMEALACMVFGGRPDFHLRAKGQRLDNC